MSSSEQKMPKQIKRCSNYSRPQCGAVTQKCTRNREQGAKQNDHTPSLKCKNSKKKKKKKKRHHPIDKKWCRDIIF